MGGRGLPEPRSCQAAQTRAMEQGSAAAAAGPALVAVLALLCTAARAGDTCPGESNARGAAPMWTRSASGRPPLACQARARPAANRPSWFLGIAHFKCHFPEEEAGGQRRAARPRGDGHCSEATPAGPEPWPAPAAGTLGRHPSPLGLRVHEQSGGWGGGEVGGDPPGPGAGHPQVPPRGVCAQGRQRAGYCPAQISGHWHRGRETSHPVWPVFQALGTEETRGVSGVAGQAWLGSPFPAWRLSQAFPPALIRGRVRTRQDKRRGTS